MQSFIHRMILSDSDEAARGIYEAITWSANRVIVPAAVVVLAAGITLVAVNDAWAFSQLWVILALVLFAVSAFGFGTWTDKLSARALDLLDDEGVKDLVTWPLPTRGYESYASMASLSSASLR